MRILYTPRFISGADLLPWFVLGVFGQVISWPMGFALVAKGAAGWYAALETSATVVNVALSIVLLRWLGLWGTALAIPLLYLFVTVFTLWICRRLTGFRWQRASLRLLAMSTALILAGFAVQKWVPGQLGLASGGVLTAAACLLSFRGIATRLGEGHRIVRMACKIPGVRFACGI